MTRTTRCGRSAALRTRLWRRFRASSRRSMLGWAALRIPPEKLLRAMLLQAFYSIRSERQLMERLKFDLLFRWFVGIGVDDAVWDHSTFSKNRDRLLEATSRPSS